MDLLSEIINNYFYEETLSAIGFKAICGVDEAGRGPLAGRVYAAAVILDNSNPILGLDDSKKLSEKKRDILYDEIISKSISYSIAYCDEKQIDKINILNATLFAMKKAVEGLCISADYAIVDGNFIPPLEIEAKAIVKGDSLSASISAASILAKVARDRYMNELDKQYPKYLFKNHKGYGTQAHYMAILEHGILPCHRLTFLKNIEEKRKKFIFGTEDER